MLTHLAQMLTVFGIFRKQNAEMLTHFGIFRKQKGRLLSQTTVLNRKTRRGGVH